MPNLGDAEDRKMSGEEWVQPGSHFIKKIYRLSTENRFGGQQARLGQRESFGSCCRNHEKC